VGPPASAAWVSGKAAPTDKLRSENGQISLARINLSSCEDEFQTPRAEPANGVARSGTKSPPIALSFEFFVRELVMRKSDCIVPNGQLTLVLA
jgi:hypothetical protein